MRLLTKNETVSVEAKSSKVSFVICQFPDLISGKSASLISKVWSCLNSRYPVERSQRLNKLFCCAKLGIARIQTKARINQALILLILLALLDFISYVRGQFIIFVFECLLKHRLKFVDGFCAHFIHRTIIKV